MFAEKCAIRYVQKESSAGPQDERISSLCPYMDNDGIIRLRTKSCSENRLRRFWDTSDSTFQPSHGGDACVAGT